MVFVFSHDSESTHWLDPRLTNNQKMSPLECKDDGKCIDKVDMSL